MILICINWSDLYWINYLLIFISLSLPLQMFYISKVHQIVVQNIFLGVSSLDITCNCDIMDSPFLENMASLKRLLKLNKEPKSERKVNFSLLNFYQYLVKIFQIYWIYSFIHLKIEFINISVLISLRLKRLAKWVLTVHMSREQVGVNQQIHLHWAVLAPQLLTLSMYLFSKYKYCPGYYNYHFVSNIMRIPPN